MRHFYIQITGDDGGSLPLPDGPISFGPYLAAEGAKCVADSLRARGYDVKVAPLASREDAENFLYKLAKSHHGTCAFHGSYFAEECPQCNRTECAALPSRPVQS